MNLADLVIIETPEDRFLDVASKYLFHLRLYKVKKITKDGQKFVRFYIDEKDFYTYFC